MKPITKQTPANQKIYVKRQPTNYLFYRYHPLSIADQIICQTYKKRWFYVDKCQNCNKDCVLGGGVLSFNHFPQWRSLWILNLKLNIGIPCLAPLSSQHNGKWATSKLQSPHHGLCLIMPPLPTNVVCFSCFSFQQHLRFHGNSLQEPVVFSREQALLYVRWTRIRCAIQKNASRHCSFCSQFSRHNGKCRLRLKPLQRRPMQLTHDTRFLPARMRPETLGSFQQKTSIYALLFNTIVVRNSGRIKNGNLILWIWSPRRLHFNTGHHRHERWEITVWRPRMLR